jgi:hypothetical protein
MNVISLKSSFLFLKGEYFPVVFARCKAKQRIVPALPCLNDDIFNYELHIYIM